MTTPYLRQYQPAFPTLSVMVQTDDAQSDLRTALVDTGADITFVPTALLEQLGAAEGSWVTLRSHFGGRYRVSLYLVGFEINGARLPGVYVVGDDDGNEIILGRDLLNKLPLFLDGPEQQTTVLDEAAAKRLRARLNV